MKRLICIIAFLCILLGMQQAVAQPPSRKAKMESKEAGPTLSVRAQSQYTGQTDVSDDVKWKREIYRTLDLEKEKNTPLYYPEKPIGDKMNLFSLIFKLIAEGKVPAYEYTLDGTELLLPSNQLKFKDLLERFHIYYEEKVEGRRDTVLAIDNSDIPSEEVKSYFVKEAFFFDQNSSTYGAKVVAICPVLHRVSDFTSEVAKYPLFWVEYKDISPYLSRVSIMTSNLNNSSNITMNDYFTLRAFQGDIYKTTNMMNRTLSQYCPTDSLMEKEQKKIENQLETFEKNLWVSTRIKPEVLKDSTAIANNKPTNTRNARATATANSKRKGRDKESASGDSSRTKTKTEKVKKSSSSGSSSSAPKASVRRQRR